MFRKMLLSLTLMLCCLSFVNAQPAPFAPPQSPQEKKMEDHRNPISNNSDSPETDRPQVGDPAPDWELAGSDGKTYRLSDFRGVRGVVVAWYPAALTGG